MQEIWKPVVGYEDAYQVSSHGRIRRTAAGKGARPGTIRKPVRRGRYAQLILSKNNQQSLCWVHRLVAEAFVAKTDGAHQVNHIDNDGMNNRADNLEWVNHSQNALHAYRGGYRKPAPSLGESNGNAKLSESVVREMRSQHANGVSTSKLARLYGVSKQVAWRAATRRSWRHVA